MRIHLYIMILQYFMIYSLVMTNSLILNMAIEIVVSFCSYKMVLFDGYVSLPEGFVLLEMGSSPNYIA